MAGSDAQRVQCHKHADCWLPCPEFSRLSTSTLPQEDQHCGSVTRRAAQVPSTAHSSKRLAAPAPQRPYWWPMALPCSGGAGVQSHFFATSLKGRRKNPPGLIGRLSAMLILTATVTRDASFHCLRLALCSFSNERLSRHTLRRHMTRTLVFFLTLAAIRSTPHRPSPLQIWFSSAEWSVAYALQPAAAAPQSHRTGQFHLTWPCLLNGSRER